MTYHCCHSLSQEAGHVKAAYRARETFLNPLTKILEYGKIRLRRPLLVMYDRHLVEDDELWDEICVLCDFATSVTEREKARKPHIDQFRSLTISTES